MKGKGHGGGKGATKNPHKGNDAMRTEGSGKTEYGGCQGNGLTGRGGMKMKTRVKGGSGGSGSY